MKDFSYRVGLEPAIDLQRRLKALCQEAGLEVVDSRMTMIRKDTMEESYRFIHVWGHEPGWEQEVPEGWEDGGFAKLKDHQFEIQAVIPLNGQWPETVTVRCMASARVGEVWNMPTLRTGKTKVRDLPQFLQQVVHQQKEIIAACQGGGRGPWEFGTMLWEGAKIHL